MIVITEDHAQQLIDMLYAHAAATESSNRMITAKQLDEELSEIYELIAYLDIGGEQIEEENDYE